MRLIDADRLKEVFRRNTVCDYADIIDNAPTVCDIEQIRNEVQRMADSKILNMKIVLELIDKYTKGDKE